jgi:hypothetical protein
MEAVGSFETLVTMYRTTQRLISEDINLHSQRRENFASHILSALDEH